MTAATPDEPTDAVPQPAAPQDTTAPLMKEPQGAFAPPPAPAYGGPAAPPPPAPAYGGPAAPPPGYVAQPPLSDADQRTWATVAHIGPVVVGFIAPLVVWLIFKDRGYFVAQEAKEALNFQITLAIAGAAFSVITVVTLGIGSILFLSFVAALVFMILGAVAANRGAPYRYPLNIRLVK